jgi:hypothetical protein
MFIEFSGILFRCLNETKKSRQLHDIVFLKAKKMLALHSSLPASLFPTALMDQVNCRYQYIIIT